ncbi:C40 family peptidase [Glutamicibacter arilaitensis]|uniref:C40 family peptidase n=1 Tax=Glutamicibacter arilaitensis TaxID=256701 RepID=UPI003FD542C9
MRFDRSTTTFSITLLALVALQTTTTVAPAEPRETSTVAVDTVKVNPHTSDPVSTGSYDAEPAVRASFYAVKTIDPDFRYDLDAPNALELAGAESSNYPAELIYEWPEENSAPNSSGGVSEYSDYDGSSDAMVRPEYRGNIIAVSDNISPIAPDTLRQKIVDISLRYQGSPYVWGGNTPSGWDCSGFVKYVYGKAGVSTARTTSSIRASGQFKRTTTPQPGDLVFQNNGGHVGIYLGNGKMIGAQNPSVGTIVHKVSRNPLFGYYTLR